MEVAQARQVIRLPHAAGKRQTNADDGCVVDKYRQTGGWFPTVRVSYSTQTGHIRVADESASGERDKIMTNQWFATRFSPTYLVIAIVSCVLAAPAAVAADASWPASVAARYKLFFGGFEVGKYSFNSKSDGKTYATTGNAEVSALFGAFKWKGGIESRGTLGAAAPSPTGYKLTFKSKSKTGSVTLGFDKAGVKTVALEPPKPPHPDAVPVKPEDLKSVFDPMSSILAMTHGNAGNPCDRTIPIFDGKIRFNLVMSSKGEQSIKETKPSGQPKELKVCKVKYVPIAGHKPKDFAKPWVDYDAMEITFRPIPSANVYVPYSVTIPTTIGSAVMAAESVDITSSDQTHIALSQ